MLLSVVIPEKLPGKRCSKGEEDWYFF